MNSCLGKPRRGGGGRSAGAGRPYTGFMTRLHSDRFVAAVAACFLTAASWCQPVDIASRLEPVREQHGLPALAALVTDSDRTLASGAVGVRAWGAESSVTTGDLWHLGSCSKSMNGTLAAIVIHQGKLDWDTTVGEVFGEEFLDLHEGYVDATLEQLLCHRGGAATPPPPRGWVAARKQEGSVTEQRTAFVRAVLAEPPIHEPGTGYTYSNQGVTVAAAMLERATGRSWEELARELLFEPLGMESAGFGAPGTAESINQPRGHVAAAVASIPPRPMEPGPYSDNPPAITPAGRVHMSLEDWARYVREHLKGRRGESDLLPQEMYERLHTDPFGGSYAMGWGTVERDWGGRVLGHSGSNTMWYCTVWASPEKGFAVLSATNIAGESASTATDQVSSELIAAYLGGELETGDRREGE